MNVAQIIAAKRDGEALTTAEIRDLVSGYAAEQVPDYQMAAFAMAVYFQGMTLEETTTFTEAMIESGDRMSWPPTPPPVDKHSTGGIGDKISIPLAPMLACSGVCVPMISGRGLGATGGTLDKLESIAGYRTEISNDEFRSIVAWNGCSIASASETLAPADKRLYALRDVTGTVPSIPLITASILSKKVAEGIVALVLDVKWGSGAFMKTLDQARELAKTLVAVGNQLGVKTTALITDMNQPLGRMIGNAVEIDESVDVLKGNGPEDVTELTLQLGSQLLVQSGVESTLNSARATLQDKLETGEALDRFREMVKSHGGHLDQKRIVAAAHDVVAAESGFVTRIHSERLGLAVIELGGGRKQLGDALDHSTGIECLVRLGDSVERGQTIARVFSNGSATKYAIELVGASIVVGQKISDDVPLVVESYE
ncbi:MAG: thymidine phosphorylase [Planctomycetota bacterium]